jgi:hypothetical protein
MIILCIMEVQTVARYKFELLSDITKIEIIARGTGVRVRSYLNQKYSRGQWRKLKGAPTVQYPNGRVVDVELHWFEAHGIGRVEMKIVRDLE